MLIVMAQDVILVNETFNISLWKSISGKNYTELRLETENHQISYLIGENFPQNKVNELKGLCLFEINKRISNSDSRYLVIDFDKLYYSIYNKLKGEK